MSHDDVELIYELSPVQQAMLFHTVYSPGSGVYVVQVSLRLSGRLDVDAFTRAWGRVVERHGILRSGFYWEELEKPVQVVYRDVEVEVRLERAGTPPGLQDHLDEDRERGFDLTEAPLMRLALFEVGEEDHWLVWTQHHLLTDGWSLGVLLKELFTCYEAFATGREPLLDRPRPYRDYIAWLQQQDLEAAETFWRASLEGVSEPTLLAGGEAREAGGFRESRRRMLRLGVEETAALREVARRHRLTLNTLVQGAWAVLLASWTGRRDVVFGGVVAGRPPELPGVESMVGPFINTVPARAQVDPASPLWPWLTDLQERQAEARRYEHTPLYEIQRWNGLPASSATPLFDTLLAFESYPLEQAAGELAGLAISEVQANELTNYPLNLVVTPGAELAIEALYDAGRFEPGAVPRLQEQLAGLLRAFAAAGEGTLGDLPRLLEGERHQVLVEWNDTATAFPREACLSELFGKVARESPDAPAVVGEGEVWTYRRLDEASSRLAWRLRALGVGVETPVGISLERSPELILGVLAIVKAGGAYVPLDPGYPDERLAFMLADTGARIVLVHDRTRARFEGRAHLLEVEGGGSLSREAEEGRGGDVRVLPENLACVLYTSGSTGRPKGVALIQSAVARLVLETNFVRLGPGERTGHISNISFDAATYEIWGALLTGAAVAVIPRAVVLSPVDFAAAIRDLRVTSMILTSALFTRMAREVPGAFESMSELLVGGEAMDAVAARAVLADRPPPRLINAYGPAEGTTMASWHPVRELDPEAVSVPIGRPLSNTALFVLDPAGFLVPLGAAGELCIGGEGLARGYLNRPELAAERFIPHFGGNGERLYRTGDRVRLRGDGAVEYLGRLDDQVKIRGFRIEPGEVEAVLAGHPEVRECAVVARKDAPGETRLVAYAVGPRDGAELRSYLQSLLPEYMVPSAFVLLDALPLTANGKLDRRALPAPERTSSLDGEGYAAPADPVEELLAGIWAEVLGLERVGVHDNFFVLGGHSLLATQVVSRIRGVLGVELPLRRLFESPTIAELAQGVRESGSRQAPPIVPVPRDRELPLSFAQQRLWFLDQLELGNPVYNIPLAVRLSGEVSAEEVERIFAEVIRRHEVLRTTFATRDGQPVQVIAPEPRPELERIDLSDLPAEQREERARQLAVDEARRPFDLEKGPLLRLCLARLDAQDHLLLVTVHHIVSDGWSMGVLLREVAALHEAFSRGKPAALPPLPAQYADFAVWQRDWLRGEVLEGQISYWRDRLAGAPQVLALPTDRPRPAVQTYRGASRPLRLPAAVAEAVQGLCRLEGVTPFMVLLAAWSVLLGRHAGQDDLLVGTPIAGRNRREIEGLIGFFVNTLVLRAELAGGLTFAELLAQARQTALDAYAHQDLPFERLVEELVPERDMAHTPLFQVMLVLQNAPGRELAVPGLTLAPVAVDRQVAHFDLTLLLEEDASGIGGLLAYNTDLFDAATAARLLTGFQAFLTAAVEDSGLGLPDLPVLPAAERHQILLEWNDTAAPPVGDALLHQLFEAQADRRPEALAALWEGVSLTYGELEARANRLAHLLQGLGAGPAAPVAVWMERSLDMLVALLGAGKAGAAYLPIDAAWPAERAEAVLAGTEAGIVVTRRAHLPAVQSLQWRLPRLAEAVCLDVEAPKPPPEPLDAEATRELWDVVAERAVDWVTAAGFWSSYTGEPFTEAEVLEYRDRVVGLAGPWLGPEARVLEIGCGSGLILWELAPRVGRYVGLDPSERTQERNRARAEREGHPNLELLTGFAHEIEALEPGSFDLVILASTAQFFPGLGYLERVIELALARLAPGGGVVVADLLDPRRQEDFRGSLLEHAAAHPDSAAAQSAGRLGERRELKVDEGFFADLAAALPEAAGARVLHRREGFANELRFRYDVVLQKAASSVIAERPARRAKRVWTGWHVAGHPAERPRPVASPIDVAYVIHTSGSTGQPKGIIVQHRPAVELARWVNATFGVGPEDRLLFVTSPAFDLSVYDVFGVLGAGGTVRVASEAELRDPERLVRRLVEEPVTIWDSAPAALQQLAPLLPQRGADEARLRLVLLSGDWIPVPLPDRVRTAFPRARVISLGGATEATVWSNWYPIGEVDPRWPSIPYGRPIANARYHVLDGDLQPCPVGVPGDLHIGGACLCVGYARLPERTAERFIPAPFSGEPGARLYATGDRARYGRDGNLEFLGRIDQQVKVRGYRIELEEIEAVLARHPRVSDAAVAVREDVPGDRRLVGYVVPESGPAPSADELRAALQRVLPDYMVPWTFVALERMPVTANGKLDRKALPAPQETVEDGSGYVEPCTDLERALAGVWREVLRRPRVGRTDNFFELGGSSLLATQVLSRVRQVFAVELPLRALFEDRTLEGLAKRVEALQGTGQKSAAPPLVAVSRVGALPLSFSQQRLWFLDQLEPGSSSYNVAAALRLLGDLDRAVLEASLGEVVARHESLRTTFATTESGEPVQWIAPPEARAWPIPLVDLTGLPEGLRGTEALRLAVEEGQRPFDLARGPLLRALLLRVSPREHAALFTIHHIVSDGWSMEVLVSEIASLYSAFLERRPSPLPPLPLQYADFAAWQRSWLAGEALEAQLGFWRERLAGAPPVLELPADRPRPAEFSGRGGLRWGGLPARLSAALGAWTRQTDATPFMALLAAWKVLLHRLTGASDLLVGTPIANRGRTELEGLIGFFVNTLVVRTQVLAEQSFRQVALRVREGALAAYAHQDLPFERLVEELAPERSLSHSPLFQVMFVLQNNPRQGAALPGLAVEPLEVPATVSKLDLTLVLTERAGGIGEQVEFSSDLFDAPTIDRWLGHFGVLLEEVLAGPDRPVSDLALLSEAERHQLRAEWQGEEPVRSLPPVHAGFEQQAARWPERIALVDGTEHVSYADLDRRAEALAARLAELGVGMEVRVAVFLERGWEMAVAMLAVLKAGGCYVPLDPTYPAERLAFMLADSGAAVAITQERLVGSLPDFAGAVVWVEEERAPSPALPRSAGEGEPLAYLVYTSGSTGWPKGVAIPHRVVSNLIAWQLSDLMLPEARTLQFASPSFDVSFQEVLGTLTAGGTLVIATAEHRRDPEALLSWIREAEVERLFLPYVALQQLAETWARSGEEAPASLREVVTAGEQLRITPEIVALFEALPGCVLHNHYGPSETHALTAWTLSGSPRSWPPLPPIGRPLPGAPVHVVDPRLRPVPMGIPGELYAGGVVVGRGYLGRPDLTAERFLPDPWSAEPGGRLYRTGDLVRFSPAGVLDFMGRADTQVKIRGFRVEPGEIESVLAAHPAVREAVVGVRGAGPSRQLVAFVQPASPDATPTELRDSLRVYLKESLPDYMVPSGFVAVEAFPLTPSGKVDRRKLIALAEQAEADERPAMAPRTQVEEVLAGIWSELLGCGPVGAEDDFFELGGHSLVATRMVSRVRSVFGVELPVRALFESPTLSGFAARIESGLGQRPLSVPIRRASREGDLPLSFAQQRLWFLDQLAPGSPAYNLPFAVRLRGEASVEDLSRVFAEVARRHEALRTVFASRDGRPVQVVLPELQPELPVVDLSALPEAEREGWARQLAADEARRPFDLQRGPLLRLALVRLGERDHLLLVTLHHIVSDGWSMGVLVREVAALYGGAQLPELPVQYPDFANWQREWLQGEALEEQLAYWRDRLAGVPALSLPLDRPRPPAPSGRGGYRGVRLPAAATAGLAALNRKLGATFFMTLLASWKALLSRYTAETDVSVGTPIANRTRTELEGLIGFFVNTLVLRTDLSGSPGFGELVARVREGALGAFAHQDAPFERLVEELAPERASGQTPLFQTLFTFQNAPMGRLELPGLTLEPFEVGEPTARFDLSLTLWEDGEELAGGLGFSRDVFEEVTVARMAGHLTLLLEAAVARPEAPIAELPMLFGAEKAQLLREWNDTAFPDAEGIRLYDLFASQALRTPEAVAVESEEGAWTYGELRERAEGWRGRLAGLGVGPEVPVAIRMDRTLERVAVLLGVLAAGGAYVPLDPDYPEERLALLRVDSGARIEISEEGVTVLQSGGPAAALADPRNLAAILYTSGSTGRPKGVMLAHRGLVNRLLWAQRAYPLAPSDRVLQIASFSFDFALWEHLAPLLAGARLVLARPGGHRDAAYLVRAVAASGITVIHFVPSMLRVFLAERGVEECASLRLVLLGGEALTADLENLFFARLNVELRNPYGPTETSIDNTDWICSPGPGPVPIGRPIANNRIRVLSPEMEVVPAGVVGELYIGGAGVARGYLGRPDLTAERFVPDPYGEAGERLYRTGDLGRHRADGVLEVVGRADHQVKIRGFRVEPEEVEAALLALPGVGAAAVVVQGEGIERRLVACLAPEAGAELEIPALREELRRRIPDHMMPSGWITLPALPLTPNGKVDRRALSRLQPEVGTVRAEGEAPRTQIEELLAGVWCEVLGLERVGAHEDFFALGGHSLLAAQVASRIRTVLGVDLPLRWLFEAPTVAGLAARIQAERTAGAIASEVPLVRVPRDRDLPLSFAQSRLWFLHLLAPESHAYNVPVAVRLLGELDWSALGATLAEVAARHEVLRTTFPAGDDGEPVQRIAPPRFQVLPLVDLAGLPPAFQSAEAHILSTGEVSAPFDLVKGPVFRGLLLRLGEQEHAALITMHHIASDGWSVGVLVGEIATLYEAFRSGRPSPVPPLPVQYADFAVWQRATLSGEALEARLCYWRERLAGVPPSLSLPFDRPRPALPSNRGGYRQVRVPANQAAALTALGRRLGATPFMTLLAGWSALLSRYTGATDLTVGSPVAGRNRTELERLIGFFVNTLVLRADLSGSPSFEEVVARTRQGTLRDFDHQDAPFERLVEELSPERNLGQTPLFQVVFAFQNAPRGRLELPGLALEPIEAGEPTTRFDLTLALWEQGGELAGHLNFSRDLFDEPTVGRMAEHLTNLLAAAAASPERPIAELPVLSEPERVQLVQEWNDTEAVRPEGLCLYDLFAQQAERTPEAVAVESEEGAWTYGELLERAEGWRARLAEQGAGPEVPVAIRLDRVLERVAVLLGTLATGSPYVPLDPDYPEERLAWLRQDSGARIEVSGQGIRTLASPVRHCGGRVLPDNAAAVLYTSGSTGRPKGVVLTHRGLVNRLLWSQGLYPLYPSDRLIQTASFSFDFGLWEHVAPLMVGARLVLARPGGHRDSAYLARTVTELGITVIHFVPSMLRVFLEEEAAAACVSLRLVLSGGEPMTPDLQDLFFSRLRAELRNQYGPTETSINSHSWVCRPGWDRALVPVGFPVDNFRVRLLSPGLQPVPVGVLGEVYIGGMGVGRGYLGRPDLTAERFVPDPLAEAGERLYRTGDLARFRFDGALEVVGRADHQVKIRGFRVEIEEVEAALRALPEVREAAVVVQGDRTERRLVACLSPESGADLDISAVRQELQRCLPDYMVPAGWIVLPTLPLSPNGKVDRLALVRLQPESAARPEGDQPLTATEREVASIWAEVLGLKLAAVGRFGDFFELGGHSLLATRAVSRIRRSMGVDLPLRALFEEPTVAGLARRIEEQKSGEPGAQAPPLVPAAIDRSGPIPLSFAQERLWFLDRLMPDSPVYNVPTAVRFAGRLSPALLEAVLNEVLVRHEVLRVTFHQDSRTGQPFQQVGEPAWRPLPVIDLGGLADPQPEALRLAAEEASRPFDLEAGPLVRWSLLRLGADEHAVLFTMHHIVSDGWSTGVLASEVGALYGAAAAGEPLPLPPLPVQYTDFAVWQRGWLSGEVLESQLGYWRERLAPPLPSLQLPSDRPRPARPTGLGGSRPVAIPLATSAGLGDLARRSGATLFMVLLAGWKTLLHRYTGETDLIVGSPIANRTRVEVEGLIGFFVNTLVLRTDLSGDPGFLDLVGRVREGTLAAYAHQDLPFERLVAALAPERGVVGTPLFQVMFALQNVPFSGLELPDLSLSRFPLEATHAAFDLTLALAERDPAAGIQGGVEYSRELFDPATVDRMTAHFVTLLAGVAEEPDRPLSSVPFLTMPERHQIGLEWGEAAGDPAAGMTLSELFEAQAARHPEAVALVADGAERTYAALDSMADQMAASLVELGVGPEHVVAVLAAPSPELVAAMLAIWKAGGVYLPLDPAYPAERLSFLLEDSGARVVLAQPESLGLRVAPGVPVLDLADLARGGAGELPGRHPVVPESLAWIIYTSGSTGKPKGVGVEHRAAAAHLRTVARLWGLGPGERVLQFFSPSFDASMEDLLPALISGASVVFRGKEMWEPARLLSRAASLGITVLDLPTAFVHEWLARLEDEDLPESRLRVVCTGGEAMSPEAARAWLASPLSSSAVLLNGYGPTEAVVSATMPAVAESPLEGAPSVSIGRPLPGRSAHVLDSRGGLLPAGVPGELHLGGILARGYLGRPDLTAERFIPDPFSGRPGARLYRTGDRVRLLPDGRLEFVGRTDHQIKLRGFRIETGEVEAALASHPLVAQAAVVLREDLPGGRGLAACLVLEGGQGEIPLAELRAWLADRLPAYMAPAAFFFLPSLPLTPNDKVDRAALLRLDATGAETASEGGFVPPRTPVEEVLAGIWSEVLKLDPSRRSVGAFDNFFDLSGHSLLATQVASRIREAFGVEIPLRRLFERATLAELAFDIEAASGTSLPAGAVPALRPVPRDRPLPASSYQEWGYHLQKASPFNISIPLTVRVRGPLDLGVLQRSLSEIVRRHEALRTAFRQTADGLVQVISPAGEVPLPVVDLSGLPETVKLPTARRLAAEQNALRFDLDRGPLLRASVLVLGPAEHVVLCDIHHLVVDGWSYQIFLREMGILYTGFAQGRPPGLPELPLQPADVAWWQREVFARQELPAQLAWWRRHLEGRPPVLDLPGDRPRPAEPSTRSASWDVVLSPELTRDLRALARAAGCSLTMVLIAGIKVLLHRYTGEEDILLNSVFAARNRPELAGLIGMFMNTVPLRTGLSGSISFRELLPRVRVSVLASYAHQDVPFPKILEEVCPGQRLHRSLLSRVLFNMEIFSDGTEERAEAGPFTFEALGLVHEPAKLDLTFKCWEEGDAVVCRLIGATDLFDPESIVAMAKDLESLLEEAAADPETPLGRLLPRPHHAPAQRELSHPSLAS